MKQICIFEMSTDEIIQTISMARYKLEKTNPEYKRLRNEVVKIVKQYPSLDNIYDTNSTLELTKEECKMLQKMMEIELKIKEFDEHEILLQGAIITHMYLEKSGLLKENS